MFVHRPDAHLWSTAFGSGPSSLVALGGWAAGGEVWHDVFTHLPGWRCVSLDHRGTGASRHQGPITLTAMADDAIAVADAWGLERPVLAAESSGAAVALEAALRAPRRFAGLVLVGAAWQPAPAGSTLPMQAALRADREAVLRRFVRDCLPEPGSEALQGWGLDVLRRASPEATVELLALREAVALDDRLGAIGLPVLLLHGTDDRIVPSASSQTLARRLADAELELLPGLGHVPLVTAPQRVAQAIERRFVNSELRRLACA